MGVRIFIGNEAGFHVMDHAFLFDSVSGWAFGPMFESHEDAIDFCEFTREMKDLRTMTDPELESTYNDWLYKRHGNG